MIGRRQFLRETSLGFVGCGIGVSPAFGQRSPARKKKRTTRAPAAGSPVRPSEQVNRILAPVRDQHHLPGLVGALVEGDVLAAIGAVGIRKIGSEEPIKVDDQVHLGSDTKAMTATMIATLVDEGRLSWSSTLRDLFPDEAPSFHADYQTVTLWQLLSHHAALPENTRWWGLGRGLTPTEQRRALLGRVLEDEPASKPGTKYAYSNVGYALAGLMAEQATGKAWETLMRERLFQPLGMSSAGFGPPGTPGKVDQPWGHHSRRGEIEPAQEDNPPSMGPAGTVHGSVPDWAKFAILHMRGAQGKPRILKPASFRRLHTPERGSEYGGGWFVLDRSWAGGPALMHSGSNTMWYATVWIAPLRNFAVLVATNCGGDAAAAACNEAVEALIPFHFAASPR